MQSLPITPRFSVLFSAPKHAHFPPKHHPENRVHDKFLHPFTGRSHWAPWKHFHVTMTPSKTPELWARLSPVLPQCPLGLGLGWGGWWSRIHNQGVELDFPRKEKKIAGSSLQQADRHQDPGLSTFSNLNLLSLQRKSQSSQESFFSPEALATFRHQFLRDLCRRAPLLRAQLPLSAKGYQPLDTIWQQEELDRNLASRQRGTGSRDSERWSATIRWWENW